MNDSTEREELADALKAKAEKYANLEENQRYGELARSYFRGKCVAYRDAAKIASRPTEALASKGGDDGQ
ncbi:hypothetical protein GCM10019059_07560 [Camelimonas fluminis]|uniref:Uncharacterized protein n=1 Tax=Camelimonas fluminis TaxID=1576911 RepID=A0ABV7UF86_9HYPH|nr:hypothetical protein [Camelimonas fluminis]GHE50911.1 hypothetical protein GCM10019059_07560 [Camelimonas fluminis]